MLVWVYVNTALLDALCGTLLAASHGRPTRRQPRRLQQRGPPKAVAPQWAWQLWEDLASCEISHVVHPLPHHMCKVELQLSGHSPRAHHCPGCVAKAAPHRTLCTGFLDPVACSVSLILSSTFQPSFQPRITSALRYESACWLTSQEAGIFLQPLCPLGCSSSGGLVASCESSHGVQPMPHQMGNLEL